LDLIRDLTKVVQHPVSRNGVGGSSSSGSGSSRAGGGGGSSGSGGVTVADAMFGRSADAIRSKLKQVRAAAGESAKLKRDDGSEFHVASEAAAVVALLTALLPPQGCRGCGALTAIRYCGLECCRRDWVYQGHRKLYEAAQDVLRTGGCGGAAAAPGQASGSITAGKAATKPAAAAAVPTPAGPTPAAAPAVAVVVDGRLSV